jgi:hypothetical protein
MLMNWGEFGNQKYDIYVYKGKLVLGTTEIPMNKLAENEQLIKDFLATKRFHINFSLLNSANKSYTPYFHPVKLENGEIVFEEKKFLPYVLSRMTTNIMPKAEYDKLGLPQFAQKNIEIASIHLPGKPITISEETTATPEVTKEPASTVPNSFDETLAEMGFNLNPLFDIAGSTPEDLYENSEPDIPEDMPLATPENAPELFGKPVESEAEAKSSEPMTDEEVFTLLDEDQPSEFFNAETKEEDIPIFKKMNTFEVLNDLINKGDINKQC